MFKPPLKVLVQSPVAVCGFITGMTEAAGKIRRPGLYYSHFRQSDAGRSEATLDVDITQYES